MTTGTMMLYGGIAGAVIFLILLVIVLATAGKSRKKMIEKIRKEEGIE